MNNCTTDQYLEGVADCQDCHPSCYSCFDPSPYGCLSCQNNTVLLDGQCRSSCPIGYISWDVSCQICSDLMIHCAKC